MKKPEPNPPTLCDMCGEVIPEDAPRYEMPDGFVLCEDSDCRDVWLSRYKVLGKRSLID